MRGATRRAAVATAVAGLAAGRTAGAAETTRPNILWLVSEDNNPLIGAYGDRLAHTPTIDGLARDGVLYRNAYSAAPVCAPSRFGILTGVHAESCGPAHQMRATAKVAGRLSTYPQLLRDAGYHVTNNAKTDYNCDIDPARIWHATGPAAHWRSRAPGQPFMAVFNIGTTHESQLFRTLAPGNVKPADVRVPAYLPDTPTIRQAIAQYYNLMERMDGEVAARLAELAADGLADDTIVFYYSDNGGALPRSKRYCYDEGLRCALIVRAPPRWAALAKARPGSVVETPVCHIDLAPTVLSLAGLTPPPEMQGRAFLGPRARPPRRYAFGMRNRMDERDDFVRTVTDGRWRYIRNYMPHRPWGQHVGFAWHAPGYQDWDRVRLAGALTPAQARFFGPKPYEELYDLAGDRDQMRNRAGDHGARAILAELRAALDAHMLAINDNGFIPEGMAGEGWIESRDRRAYPLPRVMALAAAAAGKDAAKLPRFRAGLREANPLLRYWSAMGLLILGPDAAPAAGDLHKALDADTSAHVRVVAAEALAGLGEAVGVAALARLVTDDPTWQVQLQALNALTALGPAARPALPAIETAARRDQEYVRSAGRYLAAVLNGRYEPSTPIFELDRLTRPLPAPA